MTLKSEFSPSIQRLLVLLDDWPVRFKVHIGLIAHAIWLQCEAASISPFDEFQVIKPNAVPATVDVRQMTIRDSVQKNDFRE